MEMKPDYKKLVGGSAYGSSGKSLVERGYLPTEIPQSTESIMDGLMNDVAYTYFKIEDGANTDFSNNVQKGGRTVLPLSYFNPGSESNTYTSEKPDVEITSSMNDTWARQPHNIQNAPFDAHVLINGGSQEDREQKAKIEQYIPNQYVEKAIEPYVATFGENARKSNEQMIKEVKTMLSSVMLLSQKAYEELGEIAQQQANMTMYK